MIEEGIENDANALSAVDDCKGIEGDDEEERGGAIEPGRQYCEHSKEKGREDLERDLRQRILQEESFDRIGIIVMFAVKDGLLVRINGDILKHADEVERCEFLNEAEAGLDAVVVALEWGEEKGQADCVPQYLGSSGDDRGWIAAEIYEAAVKKEGKGNAEGCHAAG